MMESRADLWFLRLMRVCALGVVVLIALLGALLTWEAWPALRAFGLPFLWGQTWNPVTESYGALPFLYGTLASSLVALVIAVPLSIGIAIFLSELAPPRVRQLVGPLIELLAAIPSVVYGLWGIFVLVPWLRVSVEPWLIARLGFIPLFRGPPFGLGIFAAGIVLAIMIVPIIATLSREILQTIPRAQREAALAIGATPWEAIRLAVLRAGQPGIFGAVFLGLGRALGETMAVTMVIGNRVAIPTSLFAPGQTMASLLANEFAEATGALHRAALFEVALFLFLVTFCFNFGSRLLLRRILAGQSGGTA